METTLTTKKCQWLFLVPVKGGIIPQLAVYTTYIHLFIASGGLSATYHLLREPETPFENGSRVKRK